MDIASWLHADDQEAEEGESFEYENAYYSAKDFCECDARQALQLFEKLNEDAPDTER